MYLSATCYLQISNKEYQTFTAHVTSQLGQILKGIQNMHTLSHLPKERHPITFPILERIHSLLSTQADNYYNLITWAACYTAYFELWRISEFTTSSPNHSNSFTGLLLAVICSHRQPCCPTSHQNHFKTVKDRSIQAGHTHLLGQIQSSSLPCKGTNLLLR